MSETCKHKWVVHTPLFLGEPYECCANEGCGITKEEYLKQENEKQLTLPGYKNWGHWRNYNDTPERVAVPDPVEPKGSDEDTYWYDVWRSIK